MPNYPTFPKTVGPKWVNKVMPWVEQFWMRHKRYPTDSELVNRFGFTPEQLMMMHNSKFYENSLASRGIVRESSSNELSAQQVALISMLTNFSDKRSTEAKCTAVGVTAEQLNGWMKWPPFQRELAARADEITEFFYPEAQIQLTKMIKNGNFPALKFYYEITGRAQSPEVINLKLMLTRLQEVVMKHVQDPEVLMAIARDMKAITSGSETPVASEVHQNGRIHNELQS